MESSLKTNIPSNHLKDAIPWYQVQDLASIVCSIRVQKQVLECNHVVEVLCTQDMNSISFKCPIACGANLVCGHPCPGTCGRCNGKDAATNLTIKNQKCTKIWGRRSGTCNPTYRRPCHDGTDCGPCFSPYEVRFNFLNLQTRNRNTYSL
jgi:hypothetical protein